MKRFLSFAVVSIFILSCLFAGSLSVSAASTTAATVTMTDPLDNWNKTYSHTKNIQLTNIGADSCDGDKSVAQRKDNTAGSFIYNITDIKSGVVKIYFNDSASDSNNIKIYASSTDGKYKVVMAKKDNPKETKGYWYSVNYTVSSFPANTNYVKVEIPVNTKGYYTPVISQVKITYAKPKPAPTPKPSANTATMTDKLDNWDKTFSHTAGLVETNIGADATEGDTSVVQRKENTTESFIYNIKNAKSVNVKMYFNDPESDSNNIKIYGSATDGSYKELTAKKDNPFETKGYWLRVNYSVGSISANTNFIKIEIPKNSKGYYTPVISEVQITY